MIVADSLFDLPFEKLKILTELFWGFGEWGQISTAGRVILFIHVDAHTSLPRQTVIKLMFQIATLSRNIN